MHAWVVYGLLMMLWGSAAVVQRVPGQEAGLWLGAGVCIWSFVEYCLHRFCFHGAHAAPQRSAVQAWHVQHHADPEDPAFRVFPLWATLCGYIFGYALCYVLLGSLSAGLVVSGISLGYLAYELVHAMAHTVQPRSHLARALKRYHMIHHVAEPHHAFGVTSPVWDWIFGTSPHRRAPLASLHDRNHALTHQSHS